MGPQYHYTLSFGQDISANDSALARQYRQKGDAGLEAFKNPREASNQLDSAIADYSLAMELSDDPAILVQMARVYMLGGKFENARLALRKLNQKPNLGKAIQRRIYEIEAFLAFRHQDLERSETYLWKSLSGEAPWRSSRLVRGLAGIHLERLRTAPSPLKWLNFSAWFMAASLTSLFSEPSTSLLPALSHTMVSQLNRFRSTEDALDALLNLYKRYPGSEALCLEIGHYYLKQEYYLEAEYWFNKVVERYPTRDEGYRNLANLYQTTGDLTNLVTLLKSWLNVRPRSGEIMLALSQALAATPEYYDEALRWGRQSLMHLPNAMLQASAYAHLGNLYSAVHYIDGAILAYQSAITHNPDWVEPYIQLGTLYYDRQEYDLSQEVFEQALTLSPENSRICCNLGYLAWMQGHINDALDYYNESVRLDPTYDIATNNLGVLYLDHIGDIGKALALFDMTLQYNPNYALCYYNKGRAYSFLGKTIEAARCFQQAQDLNEAEQELDNADLCDRIARLFDNTEEIPYSDV